MWPIKIKIERIEKCRPKERERVIKVKVRSSRQTGKNGK